MRADPKTNRMKIDFLLRERDLDIKYFKPFAPGQRVVYFDNDNAV